VEQDQDEREGADNEQRVRRIGDAEQLRDVVEAVAPDCEHEDQHACSEPDQRVALLDAAAPDKLEDDEDEGGGGERREDRDTKRGHALSPTG
jgi:hypothetical protein